jgi:hypothetical protein
MNLSRISKLDRAKLRILAVAILVIGVFADRVFVFGAIHGPQPIAAVGFGLLLLDIVAAAIFGASRKERPCNTNSSGSVLLTLRCLLGSEACSFCLLF